MSTITLIAIGAAALEVSCSRSDVLAEVVKTSSSPSGYGVSIRCKTAASLTHRKFYLLVYPAGMALSPLQVWLFYIHSWRQVHLQAIVGQTSHMNTLLRGGQATRRVCAFSTHPGEVEVMMPKCRFTLLLCHPAVLVLF